MISNQWKELMNLEVPKSPNFYRIMGLVRFVVLGEPRPKRTGVAGLIYRGRKRIPTVNKNPKNEQAEKYIIDAYQRAYVSTLEPHVRQLLEEGPWSGAFFYAHQYFFAMTKAEAEDPRYLGLNVIRKESKPDVENLNKMANDAVQGFLLKDDCKAPTGYGEKWARRDGKEYSILSYLLVGDQDR